MKVLIICATNDTARGNTVTVERWQKGLRNYGVEIRIINPKILADTLKTWKPDLLHAHHAVRCGYPALHWSKQLNIPLIVSLSGTDLNIGPEGEIDPICLDAITQATAIVGPFRETGKRLVKMVGNLPAYYTVRRGIALEPVSTRTFHERLEALLVGGLRPVKGQARALRLVDRLRAAGLLIRLSLVGPVVDKSYGQHLFDQLKSQQEDQYLEPVSHDKMRDIYDSADVLFNCSDTEGCSNAILEAWANGLVVAANDVTGNRELLSGAPEEIALLLDEQAGFDKLFDWLVQLQKSPLETRHRRSALARNYVETNHNEEDELLELLHVYKAKYIRSR